MIEFIQDYTTKALPPETFEDGQQVTRSKESELYFVRLGVAGFVHEGTLVDQDYQPIVRRTALVEVVTTGDRRFATGGRGGEVIGVEAPQRASTGPGNTAMFSPNVVDPVADTDLHRVQVEQLTSDLAASVQQLDDHRDATTRQIEELTAELTSAQGARETALADLATAHSEKATLADERDAARKESETASGRLAELEAEVAELKSPPPSQGDDTATKPGKASK